MEIHTLHLEAVMLLFLCTLLTAGNSLLYRGMRGLHWFTLFNLLSFLSAVAVALRGHIPDLLSIVAGNLFFVGAYAVFFLSLVTLFDGNRAQMWVQYALVGVGTLAIVVWGVLFPDTTLRLVAFSIVLCLQEAHIALFLFRQEDRTARRVGGPLVLMLAALAVTNLVRIGGLLVFGAPAEYLQAGPFLSYIVMVNSCLQCGIVVGYVWMTAGLMRNDLQTEASTDPLTGLMNRRGLERVADEQIAGCMAAGKPVSVLTLDLDSFKSINDGFGHHRGDETLIEVARILLAKTRRYDLLARMGGDEFAIIMPGARLPEAGAVANRIRLAIRALQVGDETPSGVTSSIGLAQACESAMAWPQLAELCDKALYESKRQGGDRATSEFAPGVEVLE